VGFALAKAILGRVRKLPKRPKVAAFFYLWRIKGREENIFFSLSFIRQGRKRKFFMCLKLWDIG
jgi:hypothetical protein